MIAFVVSVNAQRVCTIGVGDSGVLGAHVSWTGHSGEPDNLSLFVGGLDSNTDQHIDWPASPEINVGDTITIQVVESEVVDLPTRRRTPEQIVADDEVFLTRMEAEHQARLAAEGKQAEGGEAFPELPSRRAARESGDRLPPLRAPWKKP